MPGRRRCAGKPTGNGLPEVLLTLLRPRDETRPIYDPSVHLPSLSLESRLGMLRRRRRVGLLRQLLAVIGPVLVGLMLVLVLAAFGFVVEPGR